MTMPGTTISTPPQTTAPITECSPLIIGSMAARALKGLPPL